MKSFDPQSGNTGGELAKPDNPVEVNIMGDPNCHVAANNLAQVEPA